VDPNLGSLVIRGQSAALSPAGSNFLSAKVADTTSYERCCRRDTGVQGQPSQWHQDKLDIRKSLVPLPANDVSGEIFSSVLFSSINITGETD